MPNITKSVEVGAPVEKVFEMLDNPENFPVYVPNVTKVSNIRRSEKRLGDSFDVVYSMMGMEFPETFTYSEYAKPKRLAARYEGRMSGSMGITLEPKGDKTLATLDVNYEVRPGPFGKIANKLLFERMNEKSAERRLGAVQEVRAQRDEHPAEVQTPDRVGGSRGGQVPVLHEIPHGRGGAVRRDGDGTPGDGVHDVARRILQQLPPRSAVSAREVRRGTESHRQELPGGGRGGKGVRLGELTRLPL